MKTNFNLTCNIINAIHSNSPKQKIEKKRNTMNKHNSVTQRERDRERG